MPRIIQLPTSQTALTAGTHALADLFDAARIAGGASLPPGGGYCEVYLDISNSGADPAYLARGADIPAAQTTITIDTADDGTWTVTLTAFDETAVVAEYAALEGDDTSDIAAGLRAALTTEVDGLGITISGATDQIIITADEALEPFTFTAITPPGTGTATDEDTGTESSPRTNEVIAGETTGENPYTFGPFFPSLDDLYLRCFGTASCIITWKMGVP